MDNQQLVNNKQLCRLLLKTFNPILQTEHTEPLTGIDPVSYSYQEYILPLNYRGKYALRISSGGRNRTCGGLIQSQTGMPTYHPGILW